MNGCGVFAWVKDFDDGACALVSRGDAMNPIVCRECGNGMDDESLSKLVVLGYGLDVSPCCT